LVRFKNVEPPNHFTVNLSEKVGITSGDKSRSDVIATVKEFEDRKAILERIFYPERIRSTKISSEWHLDYLDQTIETNSDELDDLVYQELKYKELGIISPTTSLQVDQSILTILATPAIGIDKPDPGGMLIEHTIVLTKQAIVGINSFVDAENNPAILVFLLSVVAVILVRSEDEKFEKRDFSKFFTYCFIVILVLSAYTIPETIGASYWGRAFAEEMPDEIQTETVNELAKTAEDKIAFEIIKRVEQDDITYETLHEIYNKLNKKFEHGGLTKMEEILFRKVHRHLREKSKRTTRSTTNEFR